MHESFTPYQNGRTINQGPANEGVSDGLIEYIHPMITTCGVQYFYDVVLLETCALWMWVKLKELKQAGAKCLSNDIVWEHKPD